MKTSERRANSTEWKWLTMFILILGIAIVFLSCRVFSRIIPARMQGHVLSSLGSYRSSLLLYHRDTGEYPKNLAQLDPKYHVNAWAPEISYATGWFSYATHPMGTKIRYVTEFNPDDAGGFLYNNNPQSNDFGKIIINCTHRNFDGIRYSEI